MSDHIEEDPLPGQAPEQSQATDEPGPEGAARRKRLTRLTRLGIVAAVVVIAVAIVLIATGAGGSSPPRPGSTQATEHETDILLGGIPQNANVLGQSTAPVTLKWYGDLECPYCKEFTLGALPSIIKRWVRGGQLRIEYLSMETATRERDVFKTQQVAALAAGMQNKMWYFIELFYHEQGEEDSGYVTETYLQNLARQVPGLNLPLWTEDRNDPTLVSQVETERKAANEARFRGTPTFRIGQTGGTMYRFGSRSLTDPTRFNQAVEELLEA
jgi:hypothetical protein